MKFDPGGRVFRKLRNFCVARQFDKRPKQAAQQVPGNYQDPNIRNARKNIDVPPKPLVIKYQHRRYAPWHGLAVERPLNAIHNLLNIAPAQPRQYPIGAGDRGASHQELERNQPKAVENKSPSHLLNSQVVKPVIPVAAQASAPDASAALTAC